MRLTIFGATGRTGRPVVRQALDRGHEVAAFVRDPAKLGVEHDRLSVVEGDAYTGDGVGEAVAGADAVVSVLGQTRDGPDDLLTVAGRNVIAAMAEAGVDRFVTLVGAGVREEGESVPLSGRVMGTLLELVSGEVLADAEAHVEAVRDSDLDWTVVRTPRLGEGEHTGAFRHGTDLRLGFESVPRADVAHFILDMAEDGLYVHEMPKVGSG